MFNQKQKKKLIFMLVLTFLMVTCMLPVQAKTNVKRKADGTYSCYRNGKIIKKAWIKKGSRKKYYAGTNGRLYANGVYSIGGRKYGFNEKGVVQYGRSKINGVWYYFGSSSGELRTSVWKKVKGRLYYFKKNGQMATEQWVKRYYVDASGRRVRNQWIEDRYVGKNGKAYVGLHKISGTYYYFSKKNYNKVKNTTLKIKKQTYSFDADGKGTLINGKTGGTTKYSSEEEKLLASIIYCEAGNQSYLGKLAVGLVVLNRVHNRSFPSTIKKVIYQSGQFTPASSGALASALKSGSATADCYKAAKEAMEKYSGYQKGQKIYLIVRNKTINFTPYLYFVAKSAYSQLGLMSPTLKIGDHVFFKNWK